MNCKCPVSGPIERRQFGHVFETTSQKSLLDGHLWFSVATKHPRTPFSRVERLTCVLAVLFTAMLANILLFTYQNTTDVDDEEPFVKIGPIYVSGFAITMGVIAALITLPVNMFIVMCFSGRSLRPPRHPPPLEQTTDRYLINTDKDTAFPAYTLKSHKLENDYDGEMDAKGWR